MMLHWKHKKYNPIWYQIPDHPYRILIIVGSSSRKTNALPNLINHQPDIDQIYTTQNIHIKDNINC